MSSDSPLPSPEAASLNDEVHVSRIRDAILDLREGRMVVLVDAESRENEGDLVIASQMVRPSVINFMARFGRGLICLALTRKRARQLKLSLMSPHNCSRMRTAFTVSIESKEGVTTGISASDRAHTIATAIDPEKGPQDLLSPGHVFPLVARDGGVLERAGHTEAAVDLARLAGLYPSGVICEIMNEDGSMARRSDLTRFAQTHDLKVLTIADIIAFRLRCDRIVRRVYEGAIDSLHGGNFRMAVFRNVNTQAEHIAVWKGRITSGSESSLPLVRVHKLSPLSDVLGDRTGGTDRDVAHTLAYIAERGCGVLVLIRENPEDSLHQSLLGREKEPFDKPLRLYGDGAQILLDLGVRKMILLAHTQRVIPGLEGFGLQVAGYQPIHTSEDKPKAHL